MCLAHWLALPVNRLAVVLGMLEIVCALYLAWLNPVQGYDENWYLINSYRMRGAWTGLPVIALPYAHHRPPMLPMLLALFGDYARLVPGVAHIGGTALLFMILRRLATPTLAIAGVVLFMACGQLRMYNVFLLTEMPSVFLLLLATYCFMVNRPFWVGIVVTLLVTTHWSMAIVPPVVLAVYAVRSRWRACGWMLAGALSAAAPFLTASSVLYGHPLAPVLANLAIQGNGTNDWWYYLREFPLAAVPLTVGGVLAFCWVVANRADRKDRTRHDVCLLLLGLIAMRVVLLHLVVPKGPRFLIPVIAMLLVLSVLMLHQYGLRALRLQRLAWIVLFVSVLPGKQLLYYIHAMRNDPVRQVIAMKGDIATLDPNETIYTDLNDLAVMGHTGHLAVAVTGERSWHHALLGRDSCTRAGIPDGAAYLTWNPGPLEILASGRPTRGGTLSLVRWRAGDTSPDASHTPPLATTKDR